MGFVWECRFVSEVQGLCRKPFFLCESCSVMLPHNKICKHMVGPDHQVNYIVSVASMTGFDDRSHIFIS